MASLQYSKHTRQQQTGMRKKATSSSREKEPIQDKEHEEADDVETKE